VHTMESSCEFITQEPGCKKYLKDSIFFYLHQFFGRLSHLTLILISVFLTLMIGWVRYKTGTEYALSLFYLLPIIISVWYVGRGWGIIMSMISVTTWLTADVLLLQTFSSPTVPFINETFRLIVFLFVVYLVWEFKRALVYNTALARTDPVTGIANRLAFFEFADMELKKAQRFNYPVSIIYLDIDDFKRVNDRFGHHIGDKLLQEVSDTLLKNIRSIDMAARFGGDEMGILLPETDVTGTRILAEKLQKTLLSRMRQYGWDTTFSIGAATFQDCVVRATEMVNVADKLMYFAKKNGKNKIIYQVIKKNKKDT
jgi:diguanylate cyclase (GGDEF)-like protein